MDRRTFLQSVAAATVLPGLQGSAVGNKAVLISMLAKDQSYAQRFAAARDAGFDAIEMQTIASADEAAEIKEAARKWRRLKAKAEVAQALEEFANTEEAEQSNLREDF